MRRPLDARLELASAAYGGSRRLRCRSGATANHGCSSATAPAKAPWSANLLTGSQATFDGGSGGWRSGQYEHRLNGHHQPDPGRSGSLAVTNLTSNTTMLAAASGTKHATWTTAQPGQRYTAWRGSAQRKTARSISASIVFPQTRRVSSSIGERAGPGRCHGSWRAWSRRRHGAANTGDAVINLFLFGVAAGDGTTSTTRCSSPDGRLAAGCRPAARVPATGSSTATHQVIFPGA